MNYQISVQPRDLLFFRDARPMDGASIGAGASWPLPHVFHSAMLAAFHRLWPEPQEWEGGMHTHRRTKHDRNFDNSSLRFGSLKTAGPFPTLDGRILFPTPADLVFDDANGHSTMTVRPHQGADSLPSWLHYRVVNTVPPSKEQKVHPWIPDGSLTSYLCGNFRGISTESSDRLYTVENRPGVGIDPSTHANRDGAFYQAQYLRLCDDKAAGMVAFAECVSKNGTDIAKNFFEAGKPVILGGQSGMAHVLASRHPEFPSQQIEPVAGEFVKWTLLSPAAFAGGWLPGWIDKGSGKVLLQPEINGARHAVEASLVAAKVGKPIHFSGWRLEKGKDRAGGGPDRTFLAVPGGSVYYFKARDAEHARLLSAALQARRRSDFLGAQGFGLGVCAAWTPMD